MSLTGFQKIWRALWQVPWWVVIPYGWLILFFAIPFVIILKISVSVAIVGLPPYEALIQWVEDSVLCIRLTFENYKLIFSDDLYGLSFYKAFSNAGLSTLSCLIFGYPIAYSIVRTSPRARILLLGLVMLPFAASSLVRVYAWISLLRPQGLINSFLLYTGLLDKPLPLMGNGFAVILGIVHSYLPFMILSLYVALEKIDPNLLEAAFDLGCRPWGVFWSVVMPLSRAGAITGSLLVFIPATGEFVFPELLGGPQDVVIGRILWNEFFINRDWPRASALAILTLLILIIPIALWQRFQSKALAHLT